MLGWMGENCDEDINECEHGVCHGNAVCSDHLNGGYSCHCPEHFTGML